MKTIKYIILLTVSICSACTLAISPKERLNDQLESTIADESKLWEELNIVSYQIEVWQSGVWVDFKLKITIIGNEVTEFEGTCGEALLDFDGNNCKEALARISPEKYTIQASFEELKKSRGYFEAEWGEHDTSSWSESISITFDNQYHYPKLISYDVPEVADEEYTLEILSFKILQK